MTLEETVKKLTELELKFEGLKDTMTVFQDGINNSIYWFLAAIGIFVTLLGVVGVALYFLVQTAINKGVEKGIKDVSGTVQTEIGTLRKELKDFETSQETTIIKVIKENPQIKWARGNCGSHYMETRGMDGVLRLQGMFKEIDWDSPINYFEMEDIRSSSSVNFEIIEKYSDGMVVLIYDVPKDAVYEWKFIWINKK